VKADATRAYQCLTPAQISSVSDVSSSSKSNDSILRSLSSSDECSSDNSSNRQQCRLAVWTSECNTRGRSRAFFGLRCREDNQWSAGDVCLFDLFACFASVFVLHILVQTGTFCIACTAYIFYTGSSLTSLMLPCYSDFDLLAGPGAVNSWQLEHPSAWADGQPQTLRMFLNSS